MTEGFTLPIEHDGVLKLLPHRYPFLLIDRVVAYEAKTRVVCHKSVSGNEPFFQGHFPGKPVMPGVLVIEALAQAGGILSHLDLGGAHGGDLSYLVKVDKAKFSRMVLPGDRLELEVRINREIRNMTMYGGVARVDGQDVACADIVCARAAS
ncbi:3-hydroxyacyl-ACP dehydratase FabZ [Luteimonas abyssi]|uniref:3-hydroxyacyl-ACP dehydratase FabZ n=1 Tax=Luteimonas abyssi TaxID=1247514 RepID=UPI000737CAE4|nr:3-hydroxyacyl-ACP dehydratase FabZ [Luteimonas abyssi]